MQEETKSCKELFESFKVDEKNGLTTEQVESQRTTFGHNKLDEKKGKSIFGIFFSQLNDPMIYVLFAAAIISFVISFFDAEQRIWTTAHIDYVEPLIILAVVLLNSIIGTIQESKAEKSLEALKNMSAPSAIVKRNGVIETIPASDLVPGDIVILEEGSQIPADVRFISTINLKTDESSMTGESLPVEKDAKKVFSGPVGIGDRVNVGYMSTPIVYGHGEAIVINTGMKTEIGKIAGMLNEEVDEQTPLQKKLASLSKILGFITIGLIVIFFIIAVVQSSIQGKDLLTTIVTMFVTAISLAVAAIPEGLPAVVTIVLALGVQKMVKVNTIVRKLPSVETLGAVNVVCSDKTGTLTQNKMTVVKAYVGERFYEQQKFNDNKNFLEELAAGLSLCSNASETYGDPTEIALVNFSNVFGNAKLALEEKMARIDELPFDSVRKMMSTQHQLEGSIVNYTKGAMDQILKHTTMIKIGSSVRPITKEDVANIINASKTMAFDALRVLALASSDSKTLAEENLIFIGLVGMVDPPREEAKPAIQKFKEASITTIMITGDHKDTAFAIAKELGIADSADQCMSGDELDVATDAELQEKVKFCRVFARVSPQNKVSIVKALKANGNIVAMTGDGVNDAPSLKAADIGIAMGITGTDVAKGAADMVLADDNFSSIEKAVEEGRGIYANIKKTVLFLLSSNIGEVVCMLVAVCFGLPTPLAALHILFVNLVTDSLPAVALGYDSKDKDIMKNKPRDAKESLFSNGGYFTLTFYGIVIGIITLVAFLFYPIMEVGFDLNAIITLLNNNPTILLESETCAFVVLALSELFHMIGMSNTEKSFVHIFKSRNWLFIVALAFGLIFPVMLTEIDALSNLFGCTHLDWMQWLSLLGFSTIPLVLHELVVLVKFIIKKTKKAQ
ncbi:MAG: cation-translocating P-type ATPase [Bacilli bacterium]